MRNRLLPAVLVVVGLGALAGCSTPILRAASSGDDAVVAGLLARGVDIETKALGGCGTYPKEIRQGAGDETALICAAINGRLSTVRLLLDRGADANATDYLGRSALDYAVRSGRTDIADLLRSHGAVVGAAATPGLGAGEARRLKKALSASTVPSAPPPAASVPPVAPAAPPDAAPVAAPAVASDVDSPSFHRPEDPDAYALVVGVEHYESLPPADYAERDAAAVRAHLLALGYPPRNIAYLTGTQGSFTSIKKYVESWLPNRVTERSTVFVYFSGHGAPDLKTNEAYLVPYSGDPEYLEDTAYPLKRLYAKLNALKAKRVLVALDSCFSGAGGRSVLSKGARPLVVKVDAAPTAGGKLVALSASAGNEISGTVDDQGHGAFTYYLLKGLDGAAADGAKGVTVKSLYDYLTPKVEDAARLGNRDQTPQLFAPTPDAAASFRLR